MKKPKTEITAQVGATDRLEELRMALDKARRNGFSIQAVATLRGRIEQEIVRLQRTGQISVINLEDAP